MTGTARLNDVEWALLGAEEHVVGLACTNEDDLDEVRAMVGPEAIESPSLRRLYRKACDLRDANVPANAVSLLKALPESGLDILRTVENADVCRATGTSLGTSVRLILDRHATRLLHERLTDVGSQLHTGEIQGDEYKWRTEAIIDEARQPSGVEEPRSLKHSLRDHFRTLEERHRTGGAVGLTTGFAKLDEMTTGLHGGEVFVLGARPGTGKSIFGLQVAAHVAAQGKRALFVSVEMPLGMCLDRLLSMEGRVPLRDIRRGHIAGWADRLHRTTEDIRDWPLDVRHAPGCKPSQFRALVSSAAEPDLIVLDYMQLMQPDDPKAPRQEQVADFSRTVKEVAGRSGAAMLVLAQLNRESSKGSRSPVLSDLRESGAIEQDADVVAFLHRPEQDRPTVQLNIAKQRNGPLGFVPLVLMGEHVRLETEETRWDA